MTVKRLKCASIAVLAAPLMTQGAIADAPARWSREDRFELAEAILDGARDGLRPQDYDLARPGFNSQDDANDAVAIALAHDLFEGVDHPADESSWHISRSRMDYRHWLQHALAMHSVRASLRALRPTASAYAALGEAYLHCAGRECSTLQVNLDRWRRLPRVFGGRYLWVNTAAYRLDLIDHDQRVASHRVIVGKPGSPTPVFQAIVTGVTANPWWNVPCRIVNESVGPLIRKRPAEAARRGFVTSRNANGQLVVRQRPGAENALGQIKLEMPNRYNVYIHDTPNRELFEKVDRAFSHGCIRADDPVSIGQALIGSAENIALEDALTSGTSKTFPITPGVPVFVVYFTAEPDGKGGIVYHEDIYHRDGPSRSADQAAEPKPRSSDR